MYLLKDELHHFFQSIKFLFQDLAKLDTDSIIFVILLSITVIVVDGVLLSITKLKKNAGIAKRARTIGVDGGRSVKTKEYINDELGIAGRPDAVIEENGFFIPVEQKPLQKKIHERQIAQLLVYMRLIEAHEGKRPPYGYLILGKQSKRIKIENTEEKQLWLSGILKDMRNFLEENHPIKATPHPNKCMKCPVRDSCTAKGPIGIRSSPIVQIH
jgi:CRISPR-associated protein Cas4